MEWNVETESASSDAFVCRLSRHQEGWRWEVRRPSEELVASGLVEAKEAADKDVARFLCELAAWFMCAEVSKASLDAYKVQALEMAGGSAH